MAKSSVPRLLHHRRMDESPVTAPPPSDGDSSSSTNNSSSPSSSPPAAESPPAPPPANTVPNPSPPPPPTPSPPPPPPTPSSPPPSDESPPPSPPSNNKSSQPPPSPPSSSFAPPPPPPPPVKHSHAPPSHAKSVPSGGDVSSMTENTPSDRHSSDPNLPIILGVAGAVGFLLLILLVTICCCCKKKKRKPHNPMHYYDTSPHKGGDYYTSGPPTWHTGSQGMDHVVKLPPPPGTGGGGGWHLPPPPPMASSDMSSAYSGPHGPPLPPPSPNVALGFNKSTFSYEELAAATNGYSQANLLGQGGFGYVYKGVLPNGKEIAVKQLKSGSGQGEREFQAEVDIISRVHHRHLVSLVGYCITGAQRLLVYEFVANKTLEYHLHGGDLPVMDWPTRLKIALGSAKGLAYLHEDCHPRIIHRDIKSANILLDNNFEAMVADFGLAKLSSDNYTHVSTRVMGTFGYLAPEYASSGKLSEKSDVFSFGVMLLELITGRRPVDNTHQFMEDSLVDWARPIMTRSLADGNYDELVDTRLENNYNVMEMGCFVACAAAAVRHSARRRPKMSQIVRALEGDVSLDDLSEGVKPGQSMMFSGSTEYDSSSYAAKMNRFRKVALESSDFSNEYSGQTSDYGLNASSSSSDGYSGEMYNAGNTRNKPPRL